MKGNWHKLPLPQYRHYGDGAQRGPDPWATEVTLADVEQWRARDLANRWLTEPGIARCLTWLEMNWGRR